MLGRVKNVSAADSTELLDMAADGELDYMAAVSAEADSATIGEIERALQKLQEGTYGICEACGKPIKHRRLKARPFATQCLKCKESAERSGVTRVPASVPARAGSPITVDLTDEDANAAETSLADVFQDIEVVELF
ncbi:MAG: TraR/DksA C4-type zinc finger protein [Candidatus Brocadiae bacterium]|nr:TraR/DksA C4-type zinc finger protein [Candidatus Brocadiia bacterium]